MLIRGDARQIPLLDGVAQCCITSPPYWGLRDYGHRGQLGLEHTPDAYVAQLVAVFREVRRVLRNNGTVWLNLADSYHNFRTHNNGGAPTNTVHRGGRRDGIEGHYRPNRAHKIDGLKDKDLIGIPWRVAFALQADGWYLRSDIVWSKSNPMPESVTDRPVKAHEYLFLLTKSPRYYYDIQAVGLCPSVWTIHTTPTPDVHFATFPEALVEPCILAGCQPHGLVLDPFIGTGTTGVVAERLGRHWVGIDLAYQDIAQRHTQQRGLFMEIRDQP